MTQSIYTRTGDRGQTSLVDNSRVSKDSLRVEAYGTIDEANSWVGVARACTTHPVLGESLDYLQHRLFNCSSNLATPGNSKPMPPTIEEADVDYLEHAIDHFEEKSGELKSFILPGGNQCAAYLHVARTVVRRAERRVVSLSMVEEVDPMVQKYVNRASDFLFAAARYSNYLRSRCDVFWNPEAKRPRFPNELEGELADHGESDCEPCTSR